MNVEKLASLAEALEKEEFPEGFSWGFCNLYSCAVGLASRLFGDPLLESKDNVAEYFGLDRWQAVATFFEWGIPTNEAPTPAVIAKRIRDLLEQG